MRRSTRAAVLLLAGLIVLIGAGGIGLRIWLSPDRLSAMAVAAIARQTGYQASIGRLDVRLLSGEIEAEDVAVTAPAETVPAFAAARLRVALAPRMLLRRRLVVRTVWLDQASLRLPLHAVRRPKHGTASTHETHADWPLSVSEVHVRQGRLLWRRRELAIDTLHAVGLEGDHPRLDGQLALVGGGLDGWTLAATGTTGPWRALLQPRTQGWPFTLLAAGRRDGKAGPSLRASGTLSGARAKPSLAAQVWLTVQDMQASGEVRLERRPGPWLMARLDSPLIDVDRLAGFLASSRQDGSSTGSPAAAPAAGAGQAPRAVPPGQQTASTPPAANAGRDGQVPWRWLGVGQGEATLHVARLRVGGSQFGDLSLHGVLQDRRLDLTLDGAQGQVEVRLLADARREPPAATLSMRPLLLPRGLVRRLQGGSAAFDGDVELVGDLAAGGRDWPALLASLHGPLGASSVSGSLSPALAAALLGGGSQIGRLVAAGGPLPFACAGLHGEVAQGSVRLDLIGLRSEHARLDGRGEVGLAEGQLALALSAAARMGSLGLSAPLAVGGDLRHPHIGPDPASGDGRYTLSIGGSGDMQGGCDGLLSAARENLPGSPPPAPVASPAPRHKGPKGLDILRGLGLLR